MQCKIFKKTIKKYEKYQISMLLRSFIFSEEQKFTALLLLDLSCINPASKTLKIDSDFYPIFHILDF